jgi:hypothetical protein
MKYRITGSNDFLDPDGDPGITPPWGTLTAIDLNTGKYVWKIPLSEYPELAVKELTNTGSENYWRTHRYRGRCAVHGRDRLRHENFVPSTATPENYSGKPPCRMPPSRRRQHIWSTENSM